MGFRRTMRWALIRAGVWVSCAAISSCDGPQSALAPAGRDAARIADLFWWMSGGALLVWGAVMVAAIYAARSNREHDPKLASRFIVGGGVVFPTVVLAALLSFGLALMPDLLSPGAATAPRVRVSGERWWWRVTYEVNGRPVELANELRLPVRERSGLTLVSPDVVHAFWVPSLAGKVDMIPGRENRLALEPTRTGLFRGACAEFCGGAHAMMAFHVEALERPAYDAWLAEQARPAAAPVGERAERGAAIFDARGCGACHTVRGTRAEGTVGPDLTHVGGRHRIAGVLANDVDGFRRFVRDPEAVKPEAEMPGFAMLAAEELDALAHYLDGLE